MSPFKSAAVKGGNNKGKEPVIDVDDPSPRAKWTRSPSGVYEPHKFLSYVAFQNHENYFKDATPIVKWAVDQPSLCDTNIPIWFAAKDWNFLLSDIDVTYVNMVREHMLMPMLMEMSSNAGLEERVSPCLLFIWQISYTSTGQCLLQHRYMMI